MSDPLTDAALLHEQYAAADRLAARQAPWRLRPGPSLYDSAVGLASLTGRETVADVGCGNGGCLAELRRRGHAGTVLGLDRSPGMAKEGAAHAPTAVADAQALPLRDASVDVAFCLHMLYHVPDIRVALRELSRVIRPGGRVVVSTNGSGHAGELDALLAQAAGRMAGLKPRMEWASGRFDPVGGRALMAEVFADVAVVDLGGVIEIPDPGIVTGYLASCSPEQVGIPRGPLWSAVLAEVRTLVAAHFAAHGSFAVTNAAAVLVGVRPVVGAADTGAVGAGP